MLCSKGGAVTAMEKPASRLLSPLINVVLYFKPGFHYITQVNLELLILLPWLLKCRDSKYGSLYPAHSHKSSWYVAIICPKEFALWLIFEAF